MNNHLTLWPRLVRTVIYGTPNTNRRKRKALSTSSAHVEHLEDRTLLAATAINVDTFADVVDAGDGVTSLREAILQANSNTGDFEIRLAAGTYMLTIGGAAEDAALTGDLDVTGGNDSLTIVGVGVGQTVIEATGLNDRVFHIFAGATLDISGLSIRGGVSSNIGGGLSNAGTLSLSNVEITGNSAGTLGGGIWNDQGTVIISDSTVTGNFANEGGGIANRGGDVSVIDSSVSTNTAASQGGGIVNRSGSVGASTSTEIRGSVISENSGGGLFSSSATAWVVEDSTISGNFGASNGGISSAGDLTIVISTISNNSGSNNGGIFNNGTMSITDSLITGNTGNNNGGGIQNGSNGTAIISGSTITQNISPVGGGITNVGELTVLESILSDNTAMCHPEHFQ